MHLVQTIYICCAMICVLCNNDNMCMQVCVYTRTFSSSAAFFTMATYCIQARRHLPRVVYFQCCSAVVFWSCSRSSFSCFSDGSRSRRWILACLDSPPLLEASAAVVERISRNTLFTSCISRGRLSPSRSNPHSKLKDEHTIAVHKPCLSR